MAGAVQPSHVAVAATGVSPASCASVLSPTAAETKGNFLPVLALLVFQLEGVGCFPLLVAVGINEMSLSGFAVSFAREP